MSKYATGKHSKAISDRSGMEFPYREMVREWNGSFVHYTKYQTCLLYTSDAADE